MVSCGIKVNRSRISNSEVQKVRSPITVVNNINDGVMDDRRIGPLYTEVPVPQRQTTRTIAIVQLHLQNVRIAGHRLVIQILTLKM